MDFVVMDRVGDRIRWAAVPHMTLIVPIDDYDG